MNPRFFPFVFLFFVLASAGTLFAAEFPVLKKGMNDFTGTISAADASAINALCAQIEMNTSTQIAVLMVNSTSPYEIADYSVRTAEQNGIGKEKLDNGILMVIAKGDRAWWVSVGYGLEGDLPDGKVGEIGRSYLVPALKSGEYGQGILDTINRMGMAIGAIPPEPEPDNSAFVCIVVILLIIIFIIVVRASIAASKSGKGGNKGSGIGGGIMGGMIGGGFRGGGFGGSGGFGGGGFGGGSFGGGGAGGKF